MKVESSRGDEVPYERSFNLKFMDFLRYSSHLNVPEAFSSIERVSSFVQFLTSICYSPEVKNQLFP